MFFFRDRGPYFTWILECIDLLPKQLELGIESSESSSSSSSHTGTAAQAANPGDLRASVFQKPLAQLPKAKASSCRAFCRNGLG